MDALSDALRVLRLTGAVFLDAEFTAPWCVVSDPGRSESPLLAGAPNIVFFHVLTEGRCRAKLSEGGQTVELAAGDLIMLPRGSRHLLGSDLHLAPTLADTLVQPPVAASDFLRIAHGGGGEKTRFVCGFLKYDERLCGPMVDALPRLLRVPLGDGPATAWLTSLLQAGARETAAPRAGGETVRAKLSELLFVEALRRYIEMLPEQETGWLAGLRDRFVGRALALMHERPERDWTVEELATSVGLSRSSLAQRFTDFLGQPPMQYLTRWRLTVAAQRLRNEHASLARIASDSGYESEAAFNRAFKRALGTTPAAWRKSDRTRVAPQARGSA